MNGDKGQADERWHTCSADCALEGAYPGGQPDRRTRSTSPIFCRRSPELAGAPLPAGVTIDGRSFAPQLHGKTGKLRQWIYCYYHPRWANFTFTRYAQRTL